MKHFWAVTLMLLIFSCTSAFAADNYTISRWEWNPSSDCLELDVSTKDGKIIHTYAIPPQFEDDRSFFFVKAIHGNTSFTVPDNWVIHCDPAYAKGDGENDNGAIIFSGGDDVKFIRSTGMSIYYTDENNPLEPADIIRKPQFKPAPKDRRAKHQITKCEWNRETQRFILDVDGKNKVSVELGNEDGRDNAVHVNKISKWTQFTIPYGWFIDCNRKHTELIDGKKGETLTGTGGGIRYREGDTILFTKDTGMTIRQMYEP
ncbi:MAG: hypothetical protein IJS42_03090 [Synergistaceae bacterium]|nr:hypothetical protein [Synergistaceae bacterium]